MGLSPWGGEVGHASRERRLKSVGLPPSRRRYAAQQNFSVCATVDSNPQLPSGDRSAVRSRLEVCAIGSGSVETTGLKTGVGGRNIRISRLALAHSFAGGFEDPPFALGQALDPVRGDLVQNRVHLAAQEILGGDFRFGLSLGPAPPG